MRTLTVSRLYREWESHTTNTSALCRASERQMACGACCCTGPENSRYHKRANHHAGSCELRERASSVWEMNSIAPLDCPAIIHSPGLRSRHFVARPAGTELNSNILVNSYLELERLQQTTRKDCKRRSDELWHAFFASLYAGFYAAGERLQPGSVAEPNDFVACDPQPDESEVFGTIGHVATR
jgi:hypothetical protein